MALRLVGIGHHVGKLSVDHRTVAPVGVAELAVAAADADLHGDLAPIDGVGDANPGSDCRAMAGIDGSYLDEVLALDPAVADAVGVVETVAVEAVAEAAVAAVVAAVAAAAVAVVVAAVAAVAGLLTREPPSLSRHRPG